MTVSDTQEMRDYFGRDAMRLLTLSHEMQHQIDHEEGGRDTRKATADSKRPYYDQRGERRAYNAAYRDVYLTPEQKRRIPPWMTEEEAVRLYSQGNSRAASPLR